MATWRGQLTFKCQFSCFCFRDKKFIHSALVLSFKLFKKERKKAELKEARKKQSKLRKARNPRPPPSLTFQRVFPGTSFCRFGVTLSVGTRQHFVKCIFTRSPNLAIQTAWDDLHKDVVHAAVATPSSRASTPRARAQVCDTGLVSPKDLGSCDNFLKQPSKLGCGSTETPRMCPL